MSFTPITLTIPGRAATLTAPKAVAEPWKQRVADAVRRAGPGRYLAEPVAVELEFCLGDWFGMTSLSNLLKATIDGLSNPLFAAAPTGPRGPWSREDWWIDRLAARKTRSASEEVRILIRPTGPAHSHYHPASVVVPGEPAVWVSRTERAWRAAVGSVMGGWAGSPNPKALEMDFTISAGREADLDNLVVPVAAAMVLATHGPGRFAAVNVERLRASKRVALPGEAPHARVAALDA